MTVTTCKCMHFSVFVYVLNVYLHDFACSCACFNVYVRHSVCTRSCFYGNVHDFVYTRVWVCMSVLDFHCQRVSFYVYVHAFYLTTCVNLRALCDVVCTVRVSTCINLILFVNERVST